MPSMASRACEEVVNLSAHALMLGKLLKSRMPRQSHRDDRTERIELPSFVEIPSTKIDVHSCHDLC